MVAHTTVYQTALIPGIVCSLLSLLFSKRSIGPKTFTFSRGRRYFHIRRWGGLDLASSLEEKFGVRFSQVHQIRGKIWGVLSLQNTKSGKESQFWGHLGLYLKFKGQNLGYLSPIFLEAKFGAKPPPRPSYMEVLPLGTFLQPACLNFLTFIFFSISLTFPCLF